MDDGACVKEGDGKFRGEEGWFRVEGREREGESRRGRREGSVFCGATDRGCMQRIAGLSGADAGVNLWTGQQSQE